MKAFEGLCFVFFLGFCLRQIRESLTLHLLSKGLVACCEDPTTRPFTTSKDLYENEGSNSLVGQVARGRILGSAVN